MARVWPVVWMTVVLLPLTTWIQMGSPNVNVSIGQTPRLLFLAGIMCTLVLTAYQQDLWMALLACYIVVGAFITKVPGAFDGALYVVFGLILIAGVREMPTQYRPWIGRGLTVIGCVEVLIALGQRLGFDPLWIGWHYVPQTARWTHGTLGNPNHLGSFLALTAVFSPWVLLPVWIAGICLAHSILGGLGMAVCLLLRARKEQVSWGKIAAYGLLGLGVFAVILLTRNYSFQEVGFRSLTNRWAIDMVAAKAGWLSPWFGMGIGSWSILGPIVQQSVLGLTTYDFGAEAYRTLHCEPLQFWFETGFVGVALAGLWLWRHRKGWASSSAAPGLAALVVTSLASFPLHQAPTAAVACALIGLGLAEETSNGRGDHEGADEARGRHRHQGNGPDPEAGRGRGEEGGEAPEAGRGGQAGVPAHGHLGRDQVAG